MKKTTLQLLAAAKLRTNLIVSLSDNDDALAALEQLRLHVFSKIEQLSQERQLATATKELYA